MNIELFDEYNVPVDIDSFDYKLFKKNAHLIAHNLNECNAKVYVAVVDYDTFYDIDTLKFLSDKSEDAIRFLTYNYTYDQCFYSSSEITDKTRVNYNKFTYVISSDVKEEVHNFIDDFENSPENYNLLRKYYQFIFANRKQYKLYLNTEYWSELRDKIKARDKYKCMLCGDYGSDLAVHHNNYDSLCYETDSDLITLCNNCHSLHHKYSKVEYHKLIKK